MLHVIVNVRVTHNNDTLDDIIIYYRHLITLFINTEA